jgi:hypothetical protein
MELGQFPKLIVHYRPREKRDVGGPRQRFVDLPIPWIMMI